MPVRRKIRWDRIIAALIVLIAVIFLIGSCARGCGSQEGSSLPPVAEQTGTETGTQESAQNLLTETAADPGSPGSSTVSSVTTGSEAARTSGAGTTSFNVPVVITDSPSADPIATTATTAGTDAPAYTLPAGYTENAFLRSALHSGSLILVNKENPCQLPNDQLSLEQVYYAEDNPGTYDISYPGHTALNKTALTQFNRLMKAYYAATSNKEIMFNYGWLDANKEKSNPESPTALDIQLHVKRTDGGYEYVTYTTPYSWIYDHMASYGFIMRYPADKSEITGISGEQGGCTAIRYVGVPHASYMTENNLCLEEYLDILRTKHNFYGGTPLSYSTPELSYKIYYVPAADGDETKLPVPKNGSYEVSGNNTDGFVVTAVIG